MNLSCEGSGGAALGDNLNKALQISLDQYYFLYFRIVRTCFSRILACGTWFWQVGLHLGVPGA